MKKFKEVAHLYLGSGLKVNIESHEEVDLPWYYETDEPLVLNGLMLDLWDDTHVKKLIPHLHPLSMLTQEITVEGYNEGKPFVPWHEIRKMTNARTFNRISKGFGTPKYYLKDIDFWCFNQLIQWHFNVFNLPEREFIDKSKLLK